MTTKKAKNMDTDLRESLHKVWLAGLGAVAAAEEQGAKVFSDLVERGEAFEERSRKQLDKVKDRMMTARDRAEARWQKLGEDFDEKVSAAVERLGVPSRDEIQTLTKRVEELNKKIEPMVKSRSTAPRKTA